MRNDSGTTDGSDAEESPVELGEDDQLREAVRQRLELDNMSLGKLLGLVGFPRTSEGFDAMRKSLGRFLKGDGRLSHHLYVRLINLCRDRLPNHDVLTPAFYSGFEKMCAAMNRSVGDFNRVRSDRFAELKMQAQGRFLLYKRPVNPRLSGWIIRSYCRIWAASTTSGNVMMVAEHQDGTFGNRDIGSEVVHDFYVGICTKKDGVLTLILRHLINGAIKNIYFDNTGFDSTTKLITSGYGLAVETCDSFSPGRLALSGCVLKRIPENFTFREISALTNFAHRENIDQEIASHVYGE